jgi:hypothetical protein
MNIGNKIYFGKVFRGQKIVSVVPLRGVTMGKLSNGRYFILRDDAKVTVR